MQDDQKGRPVRPQGVSSPERTLCPCGDLTTENEAGGLFQHPASIPESSAKPPLVAWP